MFLWCCSFLSGHRFFLCAVVVGTAEWAPSNLGGSIACLAVFSTSATMYIVREVEHVVARDC